MEWILLAVSVYLILTIFTDGELFSVIGDVLGGQITNLAKYMIRAERHPDDPDKPGGLE